VNFVRKARCHYRSSGEVQRAVRPGMAKNHSESGTHWFALLGRNPMKSKMSLVVTLSAIVGGWVLTGPRVVRAGEAVSASGYKVLEPIRHGNLTVFPVVASKSYPTGEFLTLDEGLRSGEVVVTEYGNVRGLIRRHPAGMTPAIQREGA